MEKYQTDWLASEPIFYNEKTLKISHNINDVIDWSNIEFNPEGLNNFLDFGYSVFEQTPLKNVKILRFSSEIYRKKGRLIIREYPDPVIKWIKSHKNFIPEEEVLKFIKEKINDWEKGTKGNIVIPTSGGYDSRLLNYLIEDRSRIKAFSYGISYDQENSFEVLNAKELCRKLGIEWKQIGLGDFHKYFDEWDRKFGISTHAHGMYQMEFYKKMKKYIKEGDNMLSGIIGDAWAGSIPVRQICEENDLINLGYTHGMAADSRYSKLKGKSVLKTKFFEENREMINNPTFQIVTSMRLKIVLLSYLMRLSKDIGLKPWSPFLDMDVALSMLSINPERRKKRVWQKDFFKKVSLGFEDMNLGGTKLNYLNHQAMKMVPLKPLNVNLLSEIIDRDYVEKINETILKPKYYMKLIRNLYKKEKIPFLNSVVIGLLKRVGMRDPILNAYSAYLTLKPIENVLYKKNKYK